MQDKMNLSDDDDENELLKRMISPFLIKHMLIIILLKYPKWLIFVKHF